MPVLELARAARVHPTGTVVTLLSDDPAAATDVPAWCRMLGHDLLGSGPAADGAGSAYVVRLGNRGAGNASAADSAPR
jgi:TusA-related sulfurtransferase